MDYKILANEITVPQYAGMTDTEIADALNELSQPTRRRVPVSDSRAAGTLWTDTPAGAAGRTASTRDGGRRLYRATRGGWQRHSAG